MKLVRFVVESVHKFNYNCLFQKQLVFGKISTLLDLALSLNCRLSSPIAGLYISSGQQGGGLYEGAGGDRLPPKKSAVYETKFV